MRNNLPVINRNWGIIQNINCNSRGNSITICISGSYPERQRNRIIRIGSISMIQRLKLSECVATGHRIKRKSENNISTCHTDILTTNQTDDNRNTIRSQSSTSQRAPGRVAGIKGIRTGAINTEICNNRTGYTVNTGKICFIQSRTRGLHCRLNIQIRYLNCQNRCIGITITIGHGINKLVSPQGGVIRCVDIRPISSQL